ncbi:MAG: decarboxylating 6-phosphogluconate dehydrogenase [Thermoplasmatales archaeon]|nr:decarboxylating 6-phosphogluconate dehydrogenase [Thermoplasmatales archaeon]
MEIGMVGLGKMGGNMTVRLVRGGHTVVGFARKKEVVDAVVRQGAKGADSLANLVAQLKPPRVVWLMIPSGDPVDQTIAQLHTLLAPGDLIVDGGNSYYRDTLRRSTLVTGWGLRYVDVGTSGGIWGLTEGYSMMVGGAGADVDWIRPVLETLAPGPQRGWGHMGPVGSGHFVKMVHNGIEYGMMQAYAEGFAVLQGKTEFALDLHQIAEVWRYGSVIRSWLLELTEEALAENPTLKGIEPWVADSGEGRWTVVEALDLNIPAPVITLALQQRLRSREGDPFSERLLAMMRNKFGGHEVKRET